MSSKVGVMFVLAMLSLPLLSGSVSADASARAVPEANAASHRIIAVKFHADWCGFCKSMGNVFEELQAKFDTEPVLYVTLDQTREYNRKQSTYMARALGMEKVWAEHGGRTGFILLINGKTREVAGQLTHDQTLKQMGATLLEAVKAAR